MQADDDWFEDVEIINHRHEIGALEKARTKLRRERKQPSPQISPQV